MPDEPERTLSKRFGMVLPFLTLPFFVGLVAFDGATVMLFGMAYGVAVIFLATAVGVYDAHRNPAP